MLYLTWTQKRTDGKIYYRLFETHTESLLEVTSKDVLRLLGKFGTEAKNIYTDNREIKVKDWPNCITQYSPEQDLMIMGASYILLSKLKKKGLR